MTYDGRPAASGDAGSFVGREQELAELAGLARGARETTLCGPGGIGKTRLLQRMVSGLAGGFPDGACEVALSDLRQPGVVAARVCSAVGVSEEPGVPPLETLAEALSGRRLLLALDHCDHLAGACASLVQRLLASAPGLVVVATSREALGMAGERAWPVPGLTLPPAAVAGQGEAAGYDAVRLFAERAARTSSGFTLSAGNFAAVTEACRILDGIPLAIELAAARVPVLTAGQVAAALAGRVPAPGSRDRAGPLRAAIEWSHDLLGPAEQLLLRRLSVLAGWEQDVAEEICAGDGLAAAEVCSLLTGLAEKSLVAVEPGKPGRARYRMPDMIREYAGARLEQAGEAPALGRRLRDHALHLGEYSLPIGLAQVPARWSARAQLMQQYEADAGNVRAALDWCLDQGDTEGGLRLCTAFGIRWLVRGDLTEGAGWFSAFLAADQSGVAGSVRGPALAAGAYLVHDRDDPQRAQRWGAEGLEACCAAGDLLFVSVALNVLAQEALRAGRPSQALQYSTEAVDNARRCGDKWSEGAALGGRGAAQAALGQLPQARESAEAALALMLEIDQQWGAARTMLGLARLERMLGGLAAARAHYEAALALLRPVKGDPSIARCLAGLGRVAIDQGDLAAARGYLAESLELSLHDGSRTGIALGLLAFAALAVREGRPGHAVLLAAAATSLSTTAPGQPAQGATRVQHDLDAPAGLDPAEVARLRAAGQELTAGAAAKLALDPPPARTTPGGPGNSMA
jgi:predicted ATPase